MILGRDKGWPSQCRLLEGGLVSIRGHGSGLKTGSGALGHCDVLEGKKRNDSINQPMSLMSPERSLAPQKMSKYIRDLLSAWFP